MNEQPQGLVKPRKQRVCRFFQTARGCKAGDTCPYSHDEAASEHDSSAQTLQRRHQAPLVDRSKIVQKPRPVTGDPRSFQLGQIQRRFNAYPSDIDNGVRFAFNMIPSDPDFPYDLDALQCQLDIPESYPNNGKPVLKILNKEIPRGFQINIERGFSLLARSNPEATLLGLMNRLDRQLETILSGEMAETIKIVVNKPVPSSTIPSRSQEPLRTSPPRSFVPVRPVYTTSQISEARARRDLETRQLEARFGRLPAFVKSSDGLRFTLPLDSPKRGTWPATLQSLRICTLIVPQLYPLEAPMIVLDSESTEAKNVSYAFTQRAVVNDSSTLTQLVNFLLVNIKDMASQSIEPKAAAIPIARQTEGTADSEVSHAIAKGTRSELQPVSADPDKPHLQLIPRPPEWDFGHSGPDSEDSSPDDGDLSYDSSAGSSSDQEHSEQHVYTSTPIERGVLLSFPHLELHGIELLELTSLNLTVKCTRCKDTTDVERLRSIVSDGMGDSGKSTATPRTENCKKCAQPMTIGFRADLMHAASVRGGYLDLDGCTPADLLPSSFTPTCSECSTPYPAPGVVAVRGETAMAICRTCHHKMTLRIQEERFLHISATAIRTSRMPARKQNKEKLGIVAGTELPRRGCCSHYRKSYRWFRFSCCDKVFPCDRCHDEAAEHPNEHANRIICGFCSREQNYRPEDCGICHAVLIGKKGHGFWEGGKGTRDKARMSRRDPRKYKRVGGGQARKA